MKRKLTLIILILFAAVSCIQEIRHEVRETSDREISFKATEYEAYLTRSGSEDASVPESRRMFLGMAGDDSLFITATVSEMPAPSKAETKAPTKADEGQSGGTVPESFHIVAFKDEAGTPYTDLKVTSPDGWESYSPMLYWPYEYEKIHFFAYSYNLGDNLISPTYSTSGGYTASFSYTIPQSSTSENDAEVQPDISFAISPEQDEDSAPVELGFVHALSAVEFRIGSIGDATVRSSHIELSSILSNGICTVTDPVSPETVEWEVLEPRENYTQTVKENVPFMIIPQTFTGTEAGFRISVTIGDIVHDFPLKKFSELTAEWEPNKKYTYTINKGGEVRVGVRDRVSETVKDEVKIQNTGFSTSYIRAAIVGYWSVTKEDGTEEVVASWDINDTGTGTLTKASDWSTWWTIKDGFYYYKDPVAPGDYTKPLFDRYDLTKTTGPVSGSKLKIGIAVQAVDQAAGEVMWQEALQGNN